MKIAPPVGLAILLAVSLTSCNRKKKFDIEYKDSSLEQTAEATATAFADRNEKVETEPEIEVFFTRMGRASRSTGSFHSGEFISIDAMLETIESAGVLSGLSASEKRDFSAGFRNGASQLSEALRQMSYDQHRIARVEKPSESHRIVYANHYDNEMNISTPMRWWLVRTEHGWRIHDFEDLSFGIRAVGMMSTVMKAGLAKNPDPWIKDLITVVKSMRSADMSDLDSIAKLREPIDHLLKHDLPTDIRRFASTSLVGTFMAEQEMDKAEQELIAAKKGGYDSPLAHYQMGHVLMYREEYSKALDEFKLHIDAMGEDSDILESVSDCHLQLGEIEKARAVSERALDDNPSALNCLASLAAASTKEQLADKATTARFEASGDPAAAYEMALDYLLSLEETEKARSLYQPARKTFHDKEILDYYDEQFAEPAEN